MNRAVMRGSRWISPFFTAVALGLFQIAWIVSSVAQPAFGQEVQPGTCAGGIGATCRVVTCVKACGAYMDGCPCPP